MGDATIAHRLRVGYGNNIRPGPDGAAQFFREVDWAERVGFDGFYFSEHHGLPGYVPDPLTASAMVLARTERLRSGPMPLLLPLHDPVRVAETSALVDFVSGGRLVLGVGAGYLPRDFEQADVPMAGLGTRYEEALAVVRRTWRGDGTEFTGQVLRVPPLDALVHPPIHAEGPPMWNAGSSPTGVRRAGRLGMGLVLDGLRPTREIHELSLNYRTERQAHGHGRGHVAVMRRVWLGDDVEVAAFMDRMSASLQSYVETVGDSKTPWIADLRERGISQAALSERFFAGQPELVAEELMRWAADNSVDYVIVKFQLMGTDVDLEAQFERAALMLDRVHG